VSGLDSLAGSQAFLPKQLLVDVAACPPMGATAKQPQPNPLLDNIEGMALSPDRRTLRLISDNNANPVQTTRVYTLAVDLTRAHR
jgi:hypothetical protein